MTIRSVFPQAQFSVLRIATLAMGAALCVSCGSSGGGGTSSGGSGSGGNGTPIAGQYYVVGAAGVDQGNGITIPYAPTGSTGTTSGLNLTYINAGTATGNIVANGETWIDQGFVSEWTITSGTATSLATRFRIYAATDGYIHAADLQMMTGTTAPLNDRLTTLTTSTICPTLPTILNDYANPSNSLIVYRYPGDTGPDCGTADDQFTVVPLNATSSSAPINTVIYEPVDAVRDTSGAITSVLVLVHPTFTAGNPNGSPYVAMASSTASTSLNAPSKIGGPNSGFLSGTGSSSTSGDFQSVAVVPQSNGHSIWLFRDVNSIVATDPTTTTTTVVYAIADTDQLVAPVLISGTDVYLGMSDTTGTTNKIVHIDTTAVASGTAASVEMITENTAQIQLIGIAGTNIIYTIDNGTILHMIPTDATGSTSPVALYSPPSSNFGIGTCVIVGTGLYYTVTSQTAQPNQAYFVDTFAVTPTSLAIGSSSGSQVLGGVATNPTTTANPGNPAFGGAVVATFSASGSFSNFWTGANIGLYTTGSTASSNIGTLPAPLNQDTFANAVLAPGLLQMGMPALLQISGTDTLDGSTLPATDLFQFTPGTASSLKRLTSNIQ